MTGLHLGRTAGAKLIYAPRNQRAVCNKLIRVKGVKPLARVGCRVASLAFLLLSSFISNVVFVCLVFEVY